MKRDSLAEGHVYHIFTKSIAEFRIFNNSDEFSRMLEVIRYYQRENPPLKFSGFKQLKDAQIGLIDNIREELIEIVAYCLMPTHIHLVLRQLKENGISIFVGNILNSYTRYFNIKHNRKGPLWEGRFKSILVGSDEQLLHLTRYVHLNPVTAYLVNKPEYWEMSSYREYLSEVDAGKKICKYEGILDINPASYKEFVHDRISYQRELAQIKSLCLE